MPLALRMIAGSAHVIELFAAPHIAHVFHFVIVKRALAIVSDQELLHCAVPSLGMHAKYVGGVDSQRAVDKDLDAGNVAVGIELVESVDKFLRAPDGKGRNDHLAAACAPWC